jgi:putative holliday junction resolvase
MVRALGLDIGTRRIGVALSDELGLLAGPLKVVRVRGGRELAELAALARERAVELVVVGLPTSLDGTEGPQALKVRAYVARLAPHLGALPIEFADERFTTAEAERLMIDRKLSREERRARIDAAAAAIMLQAFLDARRPPRPRYPPDDEPGG